MDKRIRAILIVLFLSVAGAMFYSIWNLANTIPRIPYSEFIEMLESGDIVRVQLKGGKITGIDSNNNRFTTYSPDVDNLVPRLLEKKVTITAEPDRPFVTVGIFASLLSVLFISIMWYIMSKKRERGGVHTSGFTKSKARVLSSGGGKKVTFEDVAGIPEVKQELKEIVEFLKNPGKFSKLGGRIPKGVLLQGPPGTGKTLLAKAIAGEADVPFFSISGSDFVEMFVGVGASRVRDLFAEAKKHAPCIIFIDEIDAVGRKRGAESVGGQDEREQTLNALLVEMDGFASEDTVVIVAATNRPDVLDPALMRPGRFDRQVTLPVPDVMGRLAILKVHAKTIVTAENLDLERLARGTPGFSGAELANLVNEAALMAARQGKEAVDFCDFEEAKDKILMGAERRSLVVSAKERETTAYHEAGHAIVAKLLPDTDPVHKVTIIPRGSAMGVTQQLPLDERRTYSRRYLVNRIKILLGGRAAEEIVLNQRTTGAVNDLHMATEIATKMVCEWGMSDEVGPLTYAQEDGGFLGGHLIHKTFSEETGKAIDREIKKLVEGCYKETVQLLRKKVRLLHMLAEILLMDETIDAEELDIIFKCDARRTRRELEKKGKQCMHGDAEGPVVDLAAIENSP